MMASLKVHSGAAAATTKALSFVRGGRFFLPSQPNAVRLNPISMKNQIQRVSASYAPRLVRTDRLVRVAAQDEEAGGGNKILAEKLDRWMRGSVEEILKKAPLRAPLLVQVFSEEDGGGNGEEKSTIRAEKAVVEEWPIVKSEWESGERRSPDGLIFVEELRDDEEEEMFNGGNTEQKDSVTRTWGVVVQGRGAECGPVCYMLKTSSVGAGIGLGLFCTHFCLVRVKSFRESAFCQFKNCWLLQ